jgi:hypothetical protein
LKTRLLVFGLFFILMLTLPQASQASVTKFYDFANGMGSDFVFKNPTGLFSLEDSQGELRLSKSTDSLSIFKQGKIQTRFWVAGDFDVQVDYKFYLPLNDGDQQQLNIDSNPNLGFANVRSNESWLGGHNYHIWSLDSAHPVPGIPTTDTGGTLRITRIGNMVSGYFKSPNAGDFTLIWSNPFNTDPVRFSMTLQNQPNSYSALDGAFDNFKITADSIYYRGSGAGIILLLDD